MYEVEERKTRTKVTPETLAQEPERVFTRLDRLMSELELEPTTFVDAIAVPYVERCYRKDPNYEINKLRRENEQLRKMLEQPSTESESLAMPIVTPAVAPSVTNAQQLAGAVTGRSAF